METIAVHCSWADAQLAEDASLQLHLLPELRTQILASSGAEYLNALALAARLPRYTDRLFLLYRPVFVDIVNRWIAPSFQDLPESILTLSALARILPFASHFKPYSREVLRSATLASVVTTGPSAAANLNEEQTTILLLALFRLLSFDRDYFEPLLHPIFFSSLLSHDSLRVRYLGVECLCLVMHFADAFCESLLQTYVGKQPVLGQWESSDIDFRLVKLWEEQRWEALEDEVESSRVATQQKVEQGKALLPSDLHHRSVLVGDVLLPRSDRAPVLPSTYVLTRTAQHGLNCLGSALLQQKPILVTGPASSGKTSLILEAARLLHKADSLITVHLNEQTDAKSLIGLHASSPTDQAFVWQPGILTRALQQGRWVLVEDIDRAPAEVLGVLRPIIENGDLFIPSRKQRVRAADGFRILATVKASDSEASRVLTRNAWLSNPRLWSVLHTESYNISEMSYLVGHRFPYLNTVLRGMLDVHENMLSLYANDAAFKGAQSRIPSLRDLLKWCRRVNRRAELQDLKLSSQAVPETFNVEIFKDAIDCYASHLSDDFLYNKVAASVARTMNISPQQVQYYISGSLEPIEDAALSVKVGRTTLQKMASRRARAPRSPFADTASSRRCLESIAAGIGFAEPYLLVGETGVGKTAVVQHIAALVGQKLTVINLSQQSEATDLLGGLKPVTTRSLILPLVETFNCLFDDTFSASKNDKFQVALSRCLEKQHWSRLLKLWQEAMGMAETALAASAKRTSAIDEARTSKRRKLATSKHESLRRRWIQFGDGVSRVRAQVEGGDKRHAFAFVEGKLIEAVRNGEWVLLDEINLASSDTLDHIISLLHDNDHQPPSILLSEAGSVEKINAHRDFRVFAAMNPATDAGKKDLAPGLRSRFTELFVQSPDKDLEDLIKVVQSYLGRLLDSDKRAAPAIARSYLEVQKLNQEHRLTDGAGDLPHFSVRSLVRCLLYTAQHSVSHGLRKAMYEGFAMSFFTVLSRESEALVLPLLIKHLLENVKNVQSFLAQQPKIQSDGQEVIAFRNHLIVKGPLTPDFQPHYIRTPSVERNLINLARASSMRRFPILLQGPTSAGKTSMIEYLAKLSGNHFVRINNHEHTDLQEYLGSYMSDVDGKLRFKDGVLVDALRQGHWLVLDELNLAPSDVLEALNRLLDDNRELLIPETQEVIRPHPNFLLFATQNPAGLYGGRKRLSRAFRNRFLEIHFDDIPEDELEIILRERAQIAPSFCTQIVAVYKKLSLLRQSSRLFEQRNSFATLRDLFRWASRPVDDRQQLAYHGFMLLGERVRDSAERDVVRTTIEETLKVAIDENIIYGAPAIPSKVLNLEGIVWTRAMRRLFVLVSSALKSREPILLVGETGCGKTQICQVIAAAFGRPLNIYNAHTNTETGDLIGSQRPVRSRSQLAAVVIHHFRSLGAETVDGVDLSVDQVITRFDDLDTSMLDAEAVRQVRTSIAAYQSLFEWSDGSLVRSMRHGEHFLLDEISLADDSVLERLNSVLEPARTILLAERGSMDNIVVADADFQFLATMNPGGDYGKRELSAALRNRLTEIWVPPLSEDDDVLPILDRKLSPEHRFLAPSMLRFSLWFRKEIQNSTASIIPLRDLLAWAQFVMSVPHLSPEYAFLHGAMMVYVDSIGANPAGMTSGFSDVRSSRKKCLEFLQTLVSVNVVSIYKEVPTLSIGPDAVQVGSFSLPRAQIGQVEQPDLVFEAPTTLRNTMRLVRSLQVDKPVLTEGSPGVGKTAIVTALAQLLGKVFTRINLSDQTDLMDLFGADAPTEDEALGHFTWKDGPLLQAMQTGGWVLLDEMNLASQSVLEGLNSCLDHRKEVYIAELDKTFSCHPEFTLFAAQNPHHQGGGRKGLPASFVNRFTVVYTDPFQKEDLLCICQTKHRGANQAAIEAVVHAVSETDTIIASNPAFSPGGPWEANLRDVTRWLQVCDLYPTVDPIYHFSSIIKHRFRTGVQQRLLQDSADSQYNNTSAESFYPRLTPELFQLGLSFLRRDLQRQNQMSSIPVPVSQLPQAKSLLTALTQAWPIVLVGSSGSGKTQLIRSLAAASGARLMEVSMNADIDTMDLLGGFEQYDAERDIEQIKHQAAVIVEDRLLWALSRREIGELRPLLNLHQVCQSPISDAKVLLSALQHLGGHQLLATLATQLRTILIQSKETRLRFVWNDGLLVDAVREGCWLILDNANLCNASVLDRLNSLLEPNGQLVISEQHSAAGGLRSIKPHPDFRIILTMDPRYGELSRAMRNRSLEIFLKMDNAHLLTTRSPRYPWTASINRLRGTAGGPKSEDAMVPFFDNLANQDLDLVRTHPVSISGLDRDLAQIRTVLHQHRAGVGSGWSRIHELMKSAINVKTPHRIEYGDQAQRLILNEPLFSGNPTLGFGELLRSLQLIWHAVQELAVVSKQLGDVSERVSTTANGVASALERSAKFYGATKRNEHTQPPFFEFASTVIEILRGMVTVLLQDTPKLGGSSLISAAVLYIKDMIEFAASAASDMAMLQAWLQIGHQVGQDLESAGFQCALQLFKLMRLNRGQSLQKMWHSWKPETPKTTEQLETKLFFEKAIGRFNSVAASLPGPKSDYVNVRSRLFETAYSTGEHPEANQLLQNAAQLMETLEAQAALWRPVEVQFQDLFDATTRRAAILEHQLTAPSMQLLRTFSNEIGSLQTEPFSVNPVQHALKILPITRRHMVSESFDGTGTMAQKLFELQNQPLRNLPRLREEAVGAMKLLSSSVSIYDRDVLPVIGEQTETLLQGILLSHKDLLSSFATVAIDKGSYDLSKLLRFDTHQALQPRDEEHSFFTAVYQNHLLPAMELLRVRTQTTVGKALVHISLAALVLIVPDKQFDPALLQRVIQERYSKRKAELETKIDAQRAFNRSLMGQDTSLVLRLLEEELAELGDEPETSTVVRPSVSSLSKVQDEFNNVLRAIVDAPPIELFQESAILDSVVSSSSRVNKTIDRLLDRLSNLDRAYDDLVVPVSQLLQSLGLGAWLVSAGTLGSNSTRQVLGVVAHVPLLGAEPGDVVDWTMRIGHGRLENALFWLEWYALRRGLDIGQARTPRTSPQNGYLQVTDRLYQQWKTRLTSDQMEAEKTSRYYAYRGDDDLNDAVEKEELAKMFPSFENDEEQSHVSEPTYEGRAMAIKLAGIHERMFTMADDEHGLRAFVLAALRGLGSDPASGNASVFGKIMPGLLLCFEAEVQAINGDHVNTAINIYTDGSISEAQKLYSLVQGVQARFYQIGEKWPEHAVPAEVNSFSDELLQLSLSSPLAKLLTKAEKLLDIIAQWQSVASREWSVASLMEHLTALIIDWRRLELASWSRLLDVEKQKFEEDARAWYFIAYEAVIYNSRRVVETGEDVTVYARELARTIEEFLRSASLGQYGPRLRLLQSLQKSLHEAAELSHDLLPVSTSVASVIAHYTRYVYNIEKALQTGRAELEKAVVEQIKLASWKDTNVNALRDSARRSHQKLFKIVRKYRALLGKPISGLQPQNSNYDQQHVLVQLVPSTEDISRIQHALSVCAAQVPGWQSRPERLRHPLVSISSLRHVYLTQIGDFDVGAELATFREDVTTSSKTLRHETPTTLTEDNTSLVRHLRERKKRLFAETVKYVAEMGIRRNLATSELEKQSSLSTVLAASPDLVSARSDSVISSANMAFHNLLDSMPLTRMALAEHSPDLTDGEVRRSVGLLEGLLSVTIRQRDMIGRSAKDLMPFTTAASSMQAIADEENRVSLRVGVQDSMVNDAQLAWLPTILDVACQILNIQSKHSELPLQPLVAALQSHSIHLRRQQEVLASLPLLPRGLVSETEGESSQQVRESLLELRHTLEDWQEREPNVHYLTRQILPWTDGPVQDSQPMVNGVHHVSVIEIDEATKAVANSIFVALQQLTAVKTQPLSSVEESGWLGQNDRSFAESWAALHVSAAAEGLTTMLEKLQLVQAEGMPLAITLVTVIAPVLEQYRLICEHMLEREIRVHLETCQLATYLAKVFITLAAEGYCSPVEKSDGQDQEGKMESGTGLGDGEGAENISKDVGADEDLSEFAKDGEKEDSDGSIEGAEDAVDMGMDEMDGEAGESEKRDGDEHDNDESGEEGDEMDEETGSVDDLDPTAVDEKMWDDVKEEAEKEKERELKGEKGKGQRSDDQTAADEGKRGEDDEEGADQNGEANEEEIEADDDAGVNRAEAENADPHVQEEKALDLPEEMQLNGEEEGRGSDLSDDAMDELSDVGQPDQVDDLEDVDREDEKSGNGGEESVNDDDEAERDGQAQGDEINQDNLSEDGQDTDRAEREGEMQYDEDGNAGGEAGAANQFQEDIDPDQKAEGQNADDSEPSERQQQGGQASENAKDSRMGQGSLESGQGRDTILERQQNEALKKLADVLDQWHQRREILNRSEDRQHGKLEADVDMAAADLEHVAGEDEGDTQALGEAGADQAQNLDGSRAIQDDDVAVEEDTAMPDADEQVKENDTVQRLYNMQVQTGVERREDGAFVPEVNEKQDRLPENDLKDTDGIIDDATSEIEHLELGQTQPPSPLTASSDATQLWNYCSQATHQFSLILTEQLRLILSPTTATKLRGDYRTGKRLNLKRIIPYIASGYKRDKIWMRRSVPSKRNYQIMLAVDDSKSMAESGADVLALQTTAMLCKSLAMLEVGDVSVVSFGEGSNEGIKVAHPFGDVWKGDESGIDVFRNFSFNQKGTDVRALMEKGLAVLRDARLKVQGGREETWQLFLIISDGHCGEHERVRRLVREGKADRVLCVFIILDNLNTNIDGEETRGESILDLKEAVFEPDPSREGEMRVVTRRYLERFPFEFYLVVRDVRDLPGVLARCLRGWFGGVEGS